MALYDQVRAFVAEQSGRDADLLAPETGLLKDLRMDAATLHAFINNYGEQFSVDVSSFSRVHHYQSDLFDPLFPMILMLFKLFSSRTAQKLSDAEPRDITLSHLATCAERKIWAPPEPQHDMPWSATTHTFDLIQALISLGVFMIVLFSVFVGVALMGFAFAQWPQFVMDPVTVLAGPIFLIFGIGYPLWSYRKARYWIRERIAALSSS